MISRHIFTLILIAVMLVSVQVALALRVNVQAIGGIHAVVLRVEGGGCQGQWAEGLQILR